MKKKKLAFNTDVLTNYYGYINVIRLETMVNRTYSQLYSKTTTNTSKVVNLLLRLSMTLLI
jgi:hypothetical protein